MSYLYDQEEFSPRQALEELARVNEFTISELEQNRNGRITDTQRSRLLLRALRPIRYTGGALIGWLLFCIVINTFVPDFILWIVAMLGGKVIIPILGAITLTCVGALVIAIFKCTHKVSLLFADLNDGKAACLEGRTSPSRAEDSGLGLARFYGEKHTTCWYVVKGEYFEVTEEAHRALPPGRFRVYHTPRSRLLLSIEPT